MDDRGGFPKTSDGEAMLADGAPAASQQLRADREAMRVADRSILSRSRERLAYSRTLLAKPVQQTTGLVR
jgi:hypothetical protein